MKKTLIKIIFSLFILNFYGINLNLNTYAAEEENTSGISIIVTEKIPGKNGEEDLCKPYPASDGSTENEGGTQLYECTVQPGFDSMVALMGTIIKYFTFIASLGAVLFIVINGIMYSMGGADPSMKDEAKKRIKGTLIGLVLLLLSGVILKLVAPWFYI